MDPNFKALKRMGFIYHGSTSPGNLKGWGLFIMGLHYQENPGSEGSYRRSSLHIQLHHPQPGFVILLGIFGL